MQRFEFSGWLGFLILILSTLSVLFITLILPSMVATALWNALIYETLGGPIIGLQQGFLLWAIVGVVLYGIFRPSIELVLDDASLAELEEMNKQLSTKEPPKTNEKNTQPTSPKPKENHLTSQNDVLSLRSGSNKEKANVPSAHWLKWRKQQAEAEQAALEAKKLAQKKQQDDATPHGHS
jgi:hypothetical protein